MAIFDERYEQEELLGRGAFSEVWKVRDIQTGVTLALKIYNPTTGIDEDGKDILTHEFALMVNANHKNLLRPLFFAISGDRPYLILPFCEKGNIGKMVGKMDEEEAWKLLRDAASALAYLHSMNPPVLHQDIKPANILLNDNGDYMLTDFGVSTQVKNSLSRVSNQDMALLSAGTISYMAPERFSRNNLPVMANDIYSLGSTIYELTSGMLPFGNDGGLLQKKGAEIPELPGNFSPLLKKTLEDCLQEEPWQRPSAEQLEEVATRAIRHPELRTAVPKTEPAAKPTTMQLPEEYLQPADKSSGKPAANAIKGTVVGQQAPPNLAGTVVGSATPEYPEDTSKKSKTPLYIGIAAIIVAALAAGWFLLSGQNDATGQETAIDTETLLKEAEQVEYVACLSLLQSDQADSIQSALVRMTALATKGNIKAIHEVAYTYAPIPYDQESDRRKRLLGWKIDADGIPTSPEINQQSINWLEKAITGSDSTDYKALYWLTYFYINGTIVKTDYGKAMQLLEKASDEAGRQQDETFKHNIDDIITQIRQIQ